MAFSQTGLALTLIGLRPGPPRPPVKRGRGRPPKVRPPKPTLLDGPPAKKGRPRRWEPKDILAEVDAWRRQASAEGRRLRRGSALCEILADAIRKHEPAKYQRLERLRQQFLDEDPSPRAALRKALRRVDRKTLALLERELSYGVTGRSATE